MSTEKITKLTIEDSSCQIDLPVDAEINIAKATISAANISTDLDVSKININNNNGSSPTNTVDFSVGDTTFKQIVDNVARAKYATKATCDSRGNKISDTYIRSNVIAALKTLGGIKIGTIDSYSNEKYTVNGLNIGLNNAIVCIRWGQITGPTSESDTSCKINFTDKQVMRAYAANKSTLDVCDEDRISIKLTLCENSSSSSGVNLPDCIYPVKTTIGAAARSYAYGFGVMTTSDSTLSLDYKINYLLIGSKILS